MKKLYFLKTMLLLCALVVGSSSVWADDTYTRITSTTDLKVDEKYIIVSETNSVAMGTISSDKGQGVSVTITNNSITLSSSSTVNVLTLGGTSTAYTLKGSQDNKYIGYNSGTKLASNTSASTNSYKWTIDFSNNNATIANVGTTARLIRGYDSNKDFRAYAASNGSNIQLYKKVDATQPSITASDINVAYNSTSGEISYSVNNEVTGASVSASTTADWISNISYATSGKVTFNVSKNTSSADRSGKVTLTYANGGTTLATKDVYVTQGHLDVDAPTFGVAAGTYDEVQSVEINYTDGATIYYTTDSSTPTTSSSVYSTAISVDVSKTIKAIAVMDGVSSTVAEAAYELKVKTPTVDPNGGTFNESQTVALNCETAGASIYYTLDDTTPTDASMAYTTSFSLTDSKTVKVIATKVGWTNSDVASATFTKIDPNNVWVKTGLSALTTDDVFVIVGYSGNNYYAMSNDNGTGDAPDAVKVTLNNNLISGTPANNIKWNISGNAKDGYTFYPNGSTSTWLYSTNTNDGTRVGTNSSKTFVVDNNYFKHSGTSRFMGIYNSSDWRCYTSINTNISGQTFSIYKQGISVTLNSACTDGKNYYGTFCSSVPFTFPSDVTVSEIGIDANGKLDVRNYAAGAVVPANTGVLISSSTPGKKVLTLASGGASILGTDNCLQPSGFAIADATTTGENCQFYRLTMHNGTDIGFWWGAENGAAFSIGANKAYLAVPTGSGVRQGLWFNDEVSGIDATLVNSEKRIVNSGVYNLQGQRVANPTKGLYIVNGKKVIKN